MAKLEGVKVIDMKDGEVTKVSYDGAEYVRIDVPKGGDIGLRVNKHIPRIAEVGRYYKITSKVIEGFRSVFYVDGEGDRANTNNPANFHYFRKVEDQEENETGLKYNIGDKVRITAEGTHGFVEGDVVEIFEVDEEHGGTQPYKVHYLDGEIENFRWVHESEIGTLKPKVGDKVRVVGAEFTGGEYENGDVLTVECIDSDGDIYVKEHDSLLYTREVEVMTTAEIKAWEKEQPQRLKVGDYAKVVDDDNNFNRKTIPAGGVVEIIDVDESDIPYQIKSVTTGEYVWAKPGHIVKATNEEVAEAKQDAEFAKFSEGDKVRLVSGGGEHPLIGFKDGEIYTVGKAKYNHAVGYRVQIKGGKVENGFATPNQLEKFSEKEAAEIEKWASIGRKVGEFKEGDIAEVILSPNASPVGTLVEVTKVNERGISAIGWSVSLGKSIYFGYIKEHLKLVAPVEQRFDRD